MIDIARNGNVKFNSNRTATGREKYIGAVRKNETITSDYYFSRLKIDQQYSPIGEAVLASRRLTVSGSMAASSSSISGGGGASGRVS